MKNDLPEVLAPAGSFEALEAAVRCGADAVYLGATEFSARRNAENFGDDRLREAVAFCHVRGLKVYLTLNILLRTAELPRAVEVARNAAAAGVDAVIVQDIGVARLLHRTFPTLALHASTQMSVHSPAALPFLKETGFCRVVAGREMSGAAIAKLCEAARALEMTVEIFVHGALCMSVSGQCLLSAVLGGRSGNRGLCAGPCRLPFAAPGGTGYDLSLKDLSLFSHLNELRESGVASLKIEGRMKRPEYVAAATAACRAAVDTGEIPERLSSALQNVFARSGFTDGYFTANLGREMFGIRTKEDVTAANAAYPFIHELYRGERQHIPLALTAKILPDQPAALTLSDGEHTVTVTGETPETAQNRALDQETVKAALEKFGGTPYIIGKTQIELANGLFLRGAALNALRREAAERLDVLRAQPCEYSEKETVYSAKDGTHRNRPALVARFEDPAQMPAELVGVKAVMLPLECDPPECPDRTVEWIVDIPRGIVSEKMIEARLRLFQERGFTAAYCGNLAAAALAKNCGLAVIGGIGLNVFNGESAAVLSDAGAKAVTLSPELQLREAVKLPTAIPKGIFAYGRLPLMLTRNCPIANGRDCKNCDRKGTVTDRMKIEFPVRCRMGFAELLNSKPIYLADRLTETVGLDFLLLYFTDESRADAERVLREYRNGGTPRGDYTRGLYYRETL